MRELPGIYRLLILFALLGVLLLLGNWTTQRMVAYEGQSSERLRVGLIDDTPPFCFYNAENKLVGMNIDLVNEMARRLGKTPMIESVSFNRLISGLMNHQYDLISPGSITHAREVVLKFIQPHLTSADVLLVHPQIAAVTSTSDFRGKPWKIGVYNGTSYIALLEQQGLQENMVIYPNQRDVFLAFYKHRVDAIVMNEEVALYLQQEYDPSIVIVPHKIRVGRQYAFAVRKTETERWKAVNQVMNEMLADGTVQRIHLKWRDAHIRETHR